MSLERIEALAAGLKALPKQLARTVDEVVRDNATEFELDNIEQLEAGRDATGQRIEPPYTGTTRELKKQKGQPSDRVTLKDRGDFYRGIVAQVRNEQVENVGTDEKTAALEEKYGPDIIGVAEPAVEAFRQELLLPELQYQTNRLLGL
jgi:hypothetical protein